ncbi:hypothetical protein GO003_018985 [Methylicorpusculum oleiharenae]|nr:hypothetical protein [Methylicorpusculum oleiharenae]MCD2452473.1 hypothetical protein [Methylicorpusculum oleiharenae]
MATSTKSLKICRLIQKRPKLQKNARQSKSIQTAAEILGIGTTTINRE